MKARAIGRGFAFLVLACALQIASGCALPIIGAARHDDEPRVRPRRTSAIDAAVHASPEQCYARLRAAHVPFQEVSADAAHGVRSPLRLLGPIDGVEVTAHDGGTLHAVLDCRLAVALLAWAPALRSAGVERVEHYSIYRPGARVGGRGKVSGHARGLAIDAARFHMMDGATLDVLTDWEERDRGGAPCPLRSDEARPSRVLRSLVCSAIDDQLFQVVLTPHHDRAHENHVHLEVKPEVDWMYVR